MPISEFVVSLGNDGRILSQGSVQDAIAHDAALAEEIKHEEETIELDEAESQTFDEPKKPKSGQLVVAEEIADGHVSWHSCKSYHLKFADAGCSLASTTVQLFLGGLGGKWPILFWIQYLCNTCLSDFCIIMETWWLGWWAQQYALTNPANVAIM